MLPKHFDTLSDGEAERLIADLQTAVEADDAERVAEILRTPGFPATLRARVGSGRNGDGSKNKLRLLFECAYDLIGGNMGPSAILWLAAATAYRDQNVEHMQALHDEALALCEEGSDDWRICSIVGRHDMAALLANINSKASLSCMPSVQLNQSILDDLEDESAHLLSMGFIRSIQTKAFYGTVIHSQWSDDEPNTMKYVKLYKKAIEMAEAVGQMDVVTAGYREIGKIYAVLGMIDEARAAFARAIEVANEHGYAWHRDQAQAELDKLDD